MKISDLGYRIGGGGAMKIGDRIKFKAVTRWSHRTATRKIVGFTTLGQPFVRYAGWPDFIVHLHEIIEVVAP